MTLPICGVHLEKNVVLEEDKLLFQEKPCIRIGNQISKSACSFPLKKYSPIPSTISFTFTLYISFRNTSVHKIDQYKFFIAPQIVKCYCCNSYRTKKRLINYERKGHLYTLLCVHCHIFIGQANLAFPVHFTLQRFFSFIGKQYKCWQICANPQTGRNIRPFYLVLMFHLYLVFLMPIYYCS